MSFLPEIIRGVCIALLLHALGMDAFTRRWWVACISLNTAFAAHT